MSRQVFKNKRIFSIVFFENIPQLILQIFYISYKTIGYTHHSSSISLITVFAMIFSFLSIVLALFEYFTKSYLLNNEMKLFITFNVYSEELQNETRYNFFYRVEYQRYNVAQEVAKILSIDDAYIELFKPIASDNGVMLVFHIRSNIIPRLQALQLIQDSIDNDRLTAALKRIYKLKELPIIKHLKAKVVFDHTNINYHRVTAASSLFLRRNMGVGLLHQNHHHHHHHNINGDMAMEMQMQMQSPMLSMDDGHMHDHTQSDQNQFLSQKQEQDQSQDQFFSLTSNSQSNTNASNTNTITNTSNTNTGSTTRTRSGKIVYANRGYGSNDNINSFTDDERGTYININRNKNRNRNTNRNRNRKKKTTTARLLRAAKSLSPPRRNVNNQYDYHNHHYHNHNHDNYANVIYDNFDLNTNANTVISATQAMSTEELTTTVALVHDTSNCGINRSPIAVTNTGLIDSRNIDHELENENANLLAPGSPVSGNNTNGNTLTVALKSGHAPGLRRVNSAGSPINVIKVVNIQGGGNITFNPLAIAAATPPMTDVDSNQQQQNHGTKEQSTGNI